MMYNISKSSFCGDLPSNYSAICTCFDYGKGSVSQKKEAMSLSKNSKKLRQSWPSIFSQFDTLITPFFLGQLFWPRRHAYMLKKISQQLFYKRKISQMRICENFFCQKFSLDFDRKSYLMSIVKYSIKRRRF